MHEAPKIDIPHCENILASISHFCDNMDVMKKAVVFTKYAIEYLNAIPLDARRKIVAIAKILEEEGRLVAPYGEKVEGQKGLFEIRAKDADGQYRVFYVYADGEDIYLLNGFTKKTQKTPLAEIKKALKIKKEMGL